MQAYVIGAPHTNAATFGGREVPARRGVFGAGVFVDLEIVGLLASLDD